MGQMLSDLTPTASCSGVNKAMMMMVKNQKIRAAVLVCV